MSVHINAHFLRFGHPRVHSLRWISELDDEEVVFESEYALSDLAHQSHCPLESKGGFLKRFIRTRTDPSCPRWVGWDRTREGTGGEGQTRGPPVRGVGSVPIVQVRESAEHAVRRVCATYAWTRHVHVSVLLCVFVMIVVPLSNANRCLAANSGAIPVRYTVRFAANCG